MPIWLAIVLAVGALIGPWIAAYYGAQKGTAVAIAVGQVQIAALAEEVKSLRESRHEHAGMLTRHEMELEMLARRAGMER
jgi:hypothetical protein